MDPAAPSEEAKEEKNKEEEEEDFFAPSLFLNTSYTLRTFDLGVPPHLELYTLPSASTDFDLTGQIPWPAASHLASLLLRTPHLVAGRCVLELGSGLGLAGLAAARSCRHLTLTDGNQVVLDVLRKNAALNLPSLQAQNSGLGGVECAVLQWGNGAQLEAVVGAAPQAPDVVIGADICYQEEFIEPLFRTVRHCVALHQAQQEPKSCADRIPFHFYLAYCERNRRTTRAILEAAKAFSFSLEEMNGSRASVDAATLEAWVYSLEPLS